MTDARARLWLGISTVGMWASLAVLMLVMRVPQKLLPTSPIAFLEELRWIALLLSGFVLIGFPFDLLGGYILPRRYNRSLTSMRRYIANWLQGVVIHGVVLTLTAIALLQFGRWGGSLGILTTVACGMLLLLFFQSALARWVGRLQSHGPLQPSNEQLAELKKYGVDPSRTQVFAGCDEGFTSGIVGLPGWKGLCCRPPGSGN